MDNATIWKMIDTYFHENPQALVRHHIDSYNDFYKNGIFQIFREKNPVVLYSRLDPVTNEYMSLCRMYMGGKDGTKIYFGKPVIHDDNNVHYMYPNEARLRNMNYSMTIHYDIELEFVDKLLPGEKPTMIGADLVKEVSGGQVTMEHYPEEEDKASNKKSLSESIQEDMEKEPENKDEKEISGGAPKSTTVKKKDAKDLSFQMTTKAASKLRQATEDHFSGNVQIRHHTLEKIFLGKFPVMVQSDFCILQGLPREVRYSMGECKNDVGGYFIIDGKEKTVVAQEKFADNMLYIKKVDDDNYLYSAEMRCVSENAAKPVRTFSVKVVAPSPKYTNKQIVVKIPNVRAPVPLFIVFRALGIVSDKEIISYCLLDMEKYESLIDVFIPSVHDASTVMTQQNALKYIALLTKGKGISHALEILTDYFLPHIGETNYIAKAFALGDIVFRLVSTYTGIELPTDRDNFKYKRVELVGSLLYDLFREYWTIQLRSIHLEFEKRLYYNQEMYENNLFGLITQNYAEIFRQRDLEKGFKKAFKGNWGAQSHTKRIGIVQDLNRLSFNSALNHLRKTNLPLDSSVKVVGPRVLHSSHWGYIDPIDTPDGGSIGLHKHLSISTYISRGVSREPMIEWLRENWNMKLVEEHSPMALSKVTKVIINGFMVGAVENPLECVATFKLYRRNALLPIYSSVAFDIRLNTIFVYCDAGRLCRPIFYKDEQTGTMSFQNGRLQKGEFTWNELTTGFNPRNENVPFDASEMKIYSLSELYGVKETNPAKLEKFLKDKAVLDYIDNSESEHSLIALDVDACNQEDNGSLPYTHCEIHNSLIFGMMSNLIIYPQNNPATRNSFSCGQSKQAVSAYHTNFQLRMDKTAVMLNYGQTPLVKSRYLEHINNEENPYGENVIVAIACYTGYNVEDAMLINEASIQRGLFRTSYISCYETHEEVESAGDVVVEKKLMNIYDNTQIVGTKFGSDYSKLDKNGLIREGTVVNDETALIGLATITTPTSGLVTESTYVDQSKFPKKGQLGVVNKAFMTDDEEGKRIAKIRIVEQRIPKIGDKMASRAGQKGTVGMIVPERDMPFTAQGLRPDIIINPHAIPSRMTIGQLVETVTGKACAMMGSFGDCTAFNQKGSKVGVFGEILTKQGFHSNGNEVLYNGMTGEQMETEIFMGPTYYMRLKHMVKDKVNSRRRGPTTALTKQPVSGRANDGGLRIGEMERDTVISHGMNDFLRESMMERADKYYLAICNHSGMISIYNPSKKLFMSPMMDGPLQYSGSLENDDLRVQHMTKFGRSFSIVSVPYSFKLLMQELQAINIQMRIVTEDNIEQMESMTHSNNIETLSQHKDVNSLMTSIQQLIRSKQENMKNGTPDDKKEIPPQSFKKHDRVHFVGDNLPNRVWKITSYLNDNYIVLTTPHAIDNIDESIMDVKSKTEEEISIVVSKEELRMNDSPEYHPITPDDSLESPPKFVPMTPEDSPPRSLSSSPEFVLGTPDVTPTTPEENPEPTMMGGVGVRQEEERVVRNEHKHGFNLYERVFLRNVKDGYPLRPWEITKMSPTSNFITVKALDTSGLTPMSAVQVVMPYDLLHEEDALKEAPKMPHLTTSMPQQPQHPQPVSDAPQQPTVIIAPKFFNGNGSDHSTQEPVAVPPEIVVKDEISTSVVPPPTPTSSPNPTTSSMAEPDFSQLVIKKMP